MRQVATELAHKRFLEPIRRKAHGVVRFSQVPLCGEEGLMASLFQHRSQSPLRNGQTARLAWIVTVVIPLRLEMWPVCTAARPGVQLGPVSRESRRTAHSTDFGD